jgi:hypothetical protein
VTIPDDHPHHLLLGHPLESYAEQVRVEFV